MPDRPDLPAVATPWEDPFGNVWCVVPRFEVDRDGWVKVYRWTSVGWDHRHTTRAYNIHPALLAGLGQERPWRPTIPPTPTPAPTPPKRVAKVVRCGKWELAVKGDVLFESLDGEQWRPSEGWGYYREFITAAAEAFAGAGDVLPGEAE